MSAVMLLSLNLNSKRIWTVMQVSDVENFFSASWLKWYITRFRKKIMFTKCASYALQIARKFSDESCIPVYGLETDWELIQRFNGEHFKVEKGFILFEDEYCSFEFFEEMDRSQDSNVLFKIK